MIPSLKKVGSNRNGIFEVLYVNDPHFFPYWHYHPQYEIMLIQKSSGTQYVGDNISSFGEGDLFLLGPNIPHIFKNSPDYFEENSSKKAKAVVLYFSSEFINSSFFDLSEMQSVKKLLMLSKRGIKIQGDSKRKAANKFMKCIKSDKEDRIIRFLSLLNFISTKADIEVLSSNSFVHHLADKELDRLNKVFNYMIYNFKSDIHLSNISEIANMSSTAFCRFFKKHTNKTMVSFLNEIRVGHACKLLIENENMNVSQICFECGYNNLTNFIIQFKKIKNCSPLAFRQKYYEGVNFSKRTNHMISAEQ
jgi:AraC-like DNA-binding protein